jgi:hypothetical protein
MEARLNCLSKGFCDNGESYQFHNRGNILLGSRNPSRKYIRIFLRIMERLRIVELVQI